MCTLFVFFAAIEYTSLLIMYRCQCQAPDTLYSISILSPEERVHVVAGHIDLISAAAIALSFILYFLS